LSAAGTPEQKAQARSAADQSSARVRATDKELENLREQLVNRRYEDPMRTAMGMDMIDRERRLIKAAQAGQ